jgi:hypothetical protein
MPTSLPRLTLPVLLLLLLAGSGRLAHAPDGVAVEEGSVDDLLGTVPQEDKARFQKLHQGGQVGGAQTTVVET